ncbi:hypothetical protein [Paenibacillus sp. P46E]|uniref:hypothetical protein n=1 Tax=Paenibacillus sp. P46E TaxID=1349436 RepID=UPI0015BFC487|nr:hypothetical protein [Paenibacillus sp. P46E]
MKKIKQELHSGEEYPVSVSIMVAQEKKECLFWSFPHGKGAIQPWRRRLWELQNNSDGE